MSAIDHTLRVRWTPPFMSSPSQSALSLPELLSQIFGFLDNADYQYTALVCKTWSEESLNNLWDDVGSDKLPTLFNLLAPVTKQSSASGRLIFERPLHMEDWSTFDKYAKRVHKLHCSPQFMDSVDSSLWLEISSSRPRSAVFPNLRQLVCTPQLAVISFLASNDLESIALISRGNYFAATRIEHSLLHIQSRMKSLQSLTLTIDHYYVSEGFHPILLKLLRGFSYIRHLTLSQKYLTPKVTGVLASFPHLKRLEWDPTNDVPATTQIFPASLKKKSFPSLEILSVGTSFSHIKPCLAKMTRLVQLTLWSFDFELPEAYTRFIQAVASAVPRLETLELRSSPTSPPSHVHNHVSFSALRPVLSLSQLKLLSIHHYHSLDLTSDDIISLIQGLPQLKELQLGHCPIVGSCDPSLKGADLLKIAPHCQQLETLGLHLNLRTVPNSDHLAPLRSLDEFAYGKSCLSSTSTMSVAVLLSRLLPDGCKLRKGSWHKYADSNKDWDEVEKLLPMFHQMRRQERQIAAAQFNISN